MKILFVIGVIIVLFVVLILIEVQIARRLKVPPFQNPSSEPLSFGSEESSLTYLVLGDSTAAGQGGKYTQGIAVLTAQHLNTTSNTKVTLINRATSGATLRDVLNDQLQDLSVLQPDIVLISAGSNDVTHLTALTSVQRQLPQIVTKILESNCEAKIVLTGAADLGASPRFLEPLSSLLSFQSYRVNRVFKAFNAHHQLTFAPIAKETGPLFKEDRSYFSVDKFHPNEKGYGLWTQILNRSLDDALQNQPSHCKK